MNTTPTSRFLTAVEDLNSAGHPHLAHACLAYYDQQATLGGPQVLAMFDEILETALRATRESIDPQEILLSPDFVFLKAMAQTLQDLDLDGFEIVIDLADEDMAAAA